MSQLKTMAGRDLLARRYSRSIVAQIIVASKNRRMPQPRANVELSLALKGVITNEVA
jgi:hypothetical protein